MLSENEFAFSSSNIDGFLKELAKEYRRLSKIPAEVIIVGGASVLVNYGFREKTYDIDTEVKASSAMNEAVNIVGDRHNLPNDWFNSDFKNTTSYTPKLSQYSKYYKTFSNIVHFYTISGAYLIAMKLRASRDYKNDLSDVAEIIAEHQNRGVPISCEDVLKAVTDLYDTVDCLPKKATNFLLEVYETTNISQLINERKKYENTCQLFLHKAIRKYGKILKEDNLDEILSLFIERESETDAEHKKRPQKKQVGYNDDD